MTKIKSQAEAIEPMTRSTLARRLLLKRLRRQAERETVGQPEVAYYNAVDGSRRLKTNCTRGRYQQLKRRALAKLGEGE